jgi:hypothetical protein
MSGTHVNADGLEVRYGAFHKDPANRDNRSAAPVVAGVEKQLVMNVVLDRIGSVDGVSFPADLDNDGTNDGFTNADPYIPAGAVIRSAELYMSEAATSAGSATIVVGTYEKDGTAIDADGLIASTGKASLTATAGIEGAGALIGEVGSATKNSYIGFAVGTAVFTAGEGKLVVTYVDV